MNTEKRLAKMEADIQNLLSLYESLTVGAEIDPNIVKALVSKLKMGDLSNVNDIGISDGQLLKFNSSTGLYEPANDNTA